MTYLGGQGGYFQKFRDPPFPPHYEQKRGVFSKVVLGFQNLDLTSEGLGEMFVGNSAKQTKHILDVKYQQSVSVPTHKYGV